MTKQNLKNLGVSLGMLGAVMMTATSYAQQTETVKKLPLARTGRLMAGMPGQTRPDTAKADAAKSDTPTYSYTLLAYPGTLSTFGVGINPGAVGSNVEAVGAWLFPDGTSQTSFRAFVGGPNGMTETYQLLNDPDAPTPQQAYSVNDSGQVVGDYIDGSGIFHSYLADGNHFIPINVPFEGATGTNDPAINNSGEIIGDWTDSAGNSHGFTLIAGTYVSFDYPGAPQTFPFSINGAGDIVGAYADANGNDHGFLKKGKSYSSIDFPGALETYANGINSEGVIAGEYCAASSCLTTNQGVQGFVLKNGVYTTLDIPGEYFTSLQSISDKGTILGIYGDADGLFYTFLATP